MCFTKGKKEDQARSLESQVLPEGPLQLQGRRGSHTGPFCWTTGLQNDDIDGGVSHERLRSVVVAVVSGRVRDNYASKQEFQKIT